MPPETTWAGPVPPGLAGSVRGAVAALALAPEDDAAVALAVSYAVAIDAAEGPEERAGALERLGPKLLAALAALNMTPAARRAATSGEGVTNVGSGPLGEFRARAAARAAR